MEIVAAGSSRGQAKVITDRKIKMKASAIQVPLGLIRLKMRIDNGNIHLLSNLFEHLLKFFSNINKNLLTCMK
jgi:hypothetical protein